MRHRNWLIIGSLAALSLVIALGVILFRMNASPPAASLNGVLWTLTSLQVKGQTHELVPNVAVTLTFHETSHTITGNSGCNSYQASYQQNNSQVRFQDFASTTVGCLGPEGAQENLYLQALSHAETLLVSANVMTITGSGGKDILQFSSSFALHPFPSAFISGDVFGTRSALCTKGEDGPSPLTEQFELIPAREFGHPVHQAL